MNRSTPPSSAGTASPDSGPEERLVLHADLVLAAHDDVGLGGSGSPWRIVHVAQQVARRGAAAASRGRARASGSVERLEHLVVDLDLRRRRRARGLGMVGGDDRDRLALVADLVEREHGLVGDLEPVGLAARARPRG